ncbi:MULTISPECIES: hypothetical protein [Mameliella]|jgi:hypothetical protein|uniref:Uncharacterized protein n=1 Tax=Mameliella alba TaxID=561184 RepID=A0A0B3SJ38_9RHOB|nr:MULTISPECIES: hypothetical protein [Mameliella]MBV6634868.1 hypothetical protein [Mameliella sp.]MCR9275143.1 hypothetical protein [Paracoccaceae bacterium]ODM46658.1 hypothetical protein A9320_25560 [Ruegeria sp. PBVC088]KHQ50569.1 hypothetical protein OA50_04937 [Mameliella alba]MBY6122185.1 hypothetical protein [Mameliella alba]
MDAIKATEIAHALYRAHGGKAEAEAAQRERQSRDDGNEREAENWRAIRGSIRQMRGANQS